MKRTLCRDMKVALIESNINNIDIGILTQALANCEELAAEGFEDWEHRHWQNTMRLQMK